jgi:hypothetical protein
MAEGGSPAACGSYACPKLLLVDVRRQLVEARERAFDQDIGSSLVGSSKSVTKSFHKEVGEISMPLFGS